MSDKVSMLTAKDVEVKRQTRRVDGHHADAAPQNTRRSSCSSPRYIAAHRRGERVPAFGVLDDIQRQDVYF